MMPWSPAPSSLLPARIDALGDVRRLRVEQHVDLAVLPVEAVLLVADILDRLAGEVLDRIDDLGRAPHLAGDDDAVGGGQRLAGDARLGQRGQIGVDDRIGNAVTDLVGMALGDRFAGETGKLISARIAPLQYR